MPSLKALFFALGASAVSAASLPLTSRQVQAALAALDVNTIDDVRGNLHLPDTTPDGLKITWQSSDPSVVGEDGWVHRQEADTFVNLTASVAGRETDGERIFTANVRATFVLDPFEGYAFSYFTGNSRAGENIFFAASNGNDALSWTELNRGQPVLTSSQGTRGLRDPFLIRSFEGDRFFLLATDLSIGSGTSWDSAVRQGSRYLEIWESRDLVNWSAQRHIQVSPANAGNTWAPEAYYDESLGAYVVFWASSLYATSGHTDNTYHRMMYSTTRDFVTFSTPVVWQDAGMSRIDSTVIRANNNYYRFTKDEGASGTGCSDIIQEVSSSLRATLPSWRIQASCIGKKAGTSAVEGPTIFRANPNDVRGQKYYLFVDEYTGRQYIPLETTNLDQPNWRVSSSYKLPTSPRHGTVVPVTKNELNNLRSRLGAAAAAEKRQDDQAAAADLIPGYYADPNVFVHGCTYYVYATTDGYDGWGGQDFYIWKSTDLVSWTRTSSPFLTLDGSDGNVPWATGNAWAPTIAEKDGKFYFYFSGHNPTYDRKTIGVAVADSPEGPFTAEPTAMILNNERIASGQAIDPCAFRDPVSGKYYFYWGNGSPAMAELNDDMVSINWDTAAEIQGLDDFREGLFVVYREGTYHLTYSIDDTGSENYRVGYATSSSPTGPWTYRGVLLQKDPSQGILGTGHNSMMNVPGTDDWYIVYHRFHIPGGGGTKRQTTLDKLTIDPQTGLFQTVRPTLGSIQPQRIQSCEA
jgi:beta-xylosidase